MSYYSYTLYLGRRMYIKMCQLPDFKNLEKRLTLLFHEQLSTRPTKKQKYLETLEKDRTNAPGK